jgi:hypothetical protein
VTTVSPESLRNQNWVQLVVDGVPREIARLESQLQEMAVKREVLVSELQANRALLATARKHAEKKKRPSGEVRPPLSLTGS